MLRCRASSCIPNLKLIPFSLFKPNHINFNRSSLLSVSTLLQQHRINNISKSPINHTIQSLRYSTSNENSNHNEVASRKPSLDFKSYFNSILEKIESTSEYLAFQNDQSKTLEELIEKYGNLSGITLEEVESSWIPDILAFKNYQEQDDLITYLLLKNYSAQASFLISLLLHHISTNKSILITMINTCTNLLKHINPEFNENGFKILTDCTTIVNKMTESQPSYNKYQDKFSKFSLGPIQVADSLINLAISFAGKPLLATSIVLALYPYKLISPQSITLTKKSLLYGSPIHASFYLKAIYELNRLLKTEFFLEPFEKQQLFKASQLLSRNKFPTIANDTFDMLKKIRGGRVPNNCICWLIRKNLVYNNCDRAVNLYKILKSQEYSIESTDIQTISLMIQRFSKSRQYLAVANEIVSKIPESLYMTEGLTEVLFTFCARTDNKDLALKLYEKLESPIPRSVLTSLLYLHVKFGDNNGAENVLKEIARRGDTIKPVEFCMVIQSALQNNWLDKAITLVKNNPIEVAHMAYSIVINYAIDDEEYEKATNLIFYVVDMCTEDSEISYKIKNHKEVLDGALVLAIKLTNKQYGSAKSRLEYLQWGIEKRLVPTDRAKILILKSIGHQAIKEDNKDVLEWCKRELGASGVHIKNIRKEFGKYEIKRTVSKNA